MQFKKYQNKVHTEEQLTREELEIAITDFLESCHRTGNHDIEDNTQYFLRENDHIQLDENEVKELFYKIEEADFSGIPE